MTLEIIPDWAMIRAAKRAGINRTPAQVRAGQMAKSSKALFYALCEMILQHETAPVDRKLLCARESHRFWGLTDAADDEKVCVYAIELWEGGFGK